MRDAIRFLAVCSLLLSVGCSERAQSIATHTAPITASAPDARPAILEGEESKSKDSEEPNRVPDSSSRTESDNDPDGEGLPAGISDENADSVMWQNIVALGKPSISRPELFNRFRDFEKRFPTSQYAARAAETAEILAQMIDEDVEHARQARKPLDEMTVHERVSELMYQLRDQNGRQFTNPGSCNIFFDPRDGGLFGELPGEKPAGAGSPASQLVAIGFDAVPQLIEHLSDSRLTRSIGHHRSFYFSHHALRVGDCAEQILEKIAGQSFYERAYTNAQMLKDNKAKDVKRLVERWWADVQEKGEMQVLIENVSAGQKNAPTQLEQLLRKHPQAAPQAVFAGIRRAKDSWVRVALIQLIAGVAGEQTTGFLLEQMKNGPDLMSRVACGRALISRNQPEAIPALIHEWKMLQAKPDSDVAATSAFRDDAIEQLVQTLAVCGSPDGIRALATQLDAQPFDRRLAVISAFGRRNGNFGASTAGSGGTLNIPDDEAAKFTDDALAALEELLVNSLDDAEERAGLSGNWNGKAFADPRLCDIAAHVLVDRIPEKYAFDLEAPTPLRDRMRTVMKNVWRREHELPLLPVPELKSIARLPDQQTKPLLTGVCDATSDDERREATAALRALGLAALPVVIEELDALPQTHPARPAMGALAVDLACIVSDIEWAKSSADPGEAFRTRIDKMKGKPLNSKGVVDVLVSLAQNLPAGVTGIKLAAERYGDHTGVHMRVSFTDRRIPTEGSQKGWESLVHVDLEKGSIHNSQGFASYEHAKEMTGYAELAGAIDKVIAAPSNSSFEIRVNLVQDE